MGYRLHFEIPNVRHESLNRSSLELGKMYKNWDEFLNKYDDLDADLGLIFNLHWQLAEFTDFVEELKERNNELIKNDLEYTLYNMELLDEVSSVSD